MIGPLFFDHLMILQGRSLLHSETLYSVDTDIVKQSWCDIKTDTSISDIEIQGAFLRAQNFKKSELAISVVFFNPEPKMRVMRGVNFVI